MCAVSSGLAVDPEGPLIQIGAYVASNIANANCRVSPLANWLWPHVKWFCLQTWTEHFLDTLTQQTLFLYNKNEYFLWWPDRSATGPIMSCTYVPEDYECNILKKGTKTKTLRARDNHSCWQVALCRCRRPLNMYIVVCIHRVYTWCIRHVYNICSAAHKRQRSQNWRPPTTMMTTRTFQAKHLFSTIPTRALQHIGICNVCTQFNLAITNPSREQKPFVVG